MTGTRPRRLALLLDALAVEVDAAEERTTPYCCDELCEPPADAGLAEALTAGCVSPPSTTAPLPADRRCAGARSPG